jgi:hypothetical protein
MDWIFSGAIWAIAGLWGAIVWMFEFLGVTGCIGVIMILQLGQIIGLLSQIHDGLKHQVI